MLRQLGRCYDAIWLPAHAYSASVSDPLMIGGRIKNAGNGSFPLFYLCSVFCVTPPGSGQTLPLNGFFCSMLPLLPGNPNSLFVLLHMVRV